MLILVRHGRTAVNAEGRLLGRADPPLDALGRAQAGSLAAAVPGVSRVFTSPLARCRETAAAFGLEATVDDRWIELDYGDIDGKALSDVPAGLWDAWRADLDFAPPGGESLRSLSTRVRAACAELAEEAAERDVVVVSHVSPIKAAVAWALGAGDEIVWRLFVAPASITRISLPKSRPAVLTSFNEQTHL